MNGFHINPYQRQRTELSSRHNTRNMQIPTARHCLGTFHFSAFKASGAVLERRAGILRRLREKTGGNLAYLLPYLSTCSCGHLHMFGTTTQNHPERRRNPTPIRIFDPERTSVTGN